MSETASSDGKAYLDMDRLTEFLENPGSYDHPVDRVELIQTHISCVALAGDFVYKVKKAVDFGFIDYSELDKQRHFARREVELNRRLCAEVHLGVLAVCDRDGRLHFAEDDEDPDAVACAVRMRRMDERRFLSALLNSGEASIDDIDRVIHVLAPFYGNQEPSTEVLDNGRPEQVRSVIEGNLDDAAESVGQCIPRFAYDALQHFNHRWFDRHHELLRRRVEERRIRDGHGDLRPEHIHLGHDNVCIYDCIEFNDAFRYIDPAADCAFLSMELDFASRPELSRHFIDGMAHALGDAEFDRLMGLYQCHRAMVRSRVEFLKSREPEIAAVEQSESLERARHYAQIALGYALAPARPMVLVVMGRIGTGKSAVAGELSEALGWPVISSDRLRKQLAGLPLTERPSKEQRASLYARDMSDRVYGRMFEQVLDHAARRESVLLDATFSKRDCRDRLRSLLSGEQLHAAFIELTADEDVIRDRLADREHRANVISDARSEDFATLAEAYEPPAGRELEDLNNVNSGRAMEDTLREICEALVAYGVDRAW